MKGLGVLLVIVSGLLAGLLGAIRVKRRARLLLDLKKMLQGFQTGIRFSAGTLSELILEQQDSKFCRVAERDGDFLWNPVKSLELAGRDLLWEQGDLDWYLGFVRGLGVSDVQGQLEHIGLYQSLLEPRLQIAQEESRQKSKVSVALGLFGGVALGLLLW